MYSLVPYIAGSHADYSIMYHDIHSSHSLPCHILHNKVAQATQSHVASVFFSHVCCVPSPQSMTGLHAHPNHRSQYFDTRATMLTKHEMNPSLPVAVDYTKLVTAQEFVAEGGGESELVADIRDEVSVGRTCRTVC